MQNLQKPDRSIETIHFFQDPTYADLREGSRWKPEFHRFTQNDIEVGQAILMRRKLRFLPFEVLMVLFGPKLHSKDPEKFRFVIAELKKIGRKRGYLYVAIQPYFFVNSEFAHVLEEEGFKSREDHILYRHTVLIDLTPSEEEIFRHFKDSLRSEMRRAMKSGLEVRLNEGPPCVETFYLLYRGSYQRSRGAYQSKEYFEKVWKTLAPKREAIFAIGYIQGKPAAGALMGLVQGNMIYLCGGTTENKDLTWFRPNEGLHWELIQLAKKWGCKFYDLGGANPEPQEGSKSSGISHFKRKFGPVHSLIGYYQCDLRPILANTIQQLMPTIRWMGRNLRRSEETDYNMM